jgi:hypothetical protein
MHKNYNYEVERQKYRPEHIKVLLIAESPPPSREVQSSRQFYWSERVRREDRLFVNTIRALYPETAEVAEAELEAHKAAWLRRFADDGWYMTEALEQSQAHEVTKPERQERIREALPRLVERVRALAAAETKLLLIKSNVYEVAAGPLREAGFTVLNEGLLDYPGRFNQRAFREKLKKYAELSRG